MRIASPLRRARPPPRDTGKRLDTQTGARRSRWLDRQGLFGAPDLAPPRVRAKRAGMGFRVPCSRSGVQNAIHRPVSARFPVGAEKAMRLAGAPAAELPVRS